MDETPSRVVRKRRVVHIAGFEPVTPDVLDRRMNSGLRKFAPLWGATTTVTEPRLADDGRSIGWDVETRGPNWATRLPLHRAALGRTDGALCRAALVSADDRRLSRAVRIRLHRNHRPLFPGQCPLWAVRHLPASPSRRLRPHRSACRLPRRGPWRAVAGGHGAGDRRRRVPSPDALRRRLFLSGLRAGRLGLRRRSRAARRRRPRERPPAIRRARCVPISAMRRPTRCCSRASVSGP